MTAAVNDRRDLAGSTAITRRDLLTAGTVTTARELLTAGEAALAAAGVEHPRVDAEWLLAAMRGVGRAELYRVLAEGLPERTADEYRAAIRRRAQREPLQYVVGWEGFRGLRLRVSPDVLIPRPETEMLVDLALDALPAPSAGRKFLVVDAGTGSGCIACAIASERDDVKVLAIDCSAAAIRTARDNVRAADLDGSVRLVVGDLLSTAKSGCADLVVANLPYLTDAMLAAAPTEVRDHEPRVALSGGADGLVLVRRIVEEAPRALRPGGRLVLETAGGEQAATVADLLRANGENREDRASRANRWTGVTITADLAGVARFVSARMTGGA